MADPAAQIVVEPESGVAPWRQVRDQIAARIGSGELPVGAKLPTIRQLARDLGLAAGTVARAYRELEAAGVLQTARRQGTVVAQRIAHDHAAEQLRVAAANYVTAVQALGYDEEAAVAAVRAQFKGER
ncbi:GntR family transcriptional regulator [Kutzneria buriramensis]|uniref:DNA-binding transcriptional regulator YhcF (GntR family) n=1 Tax=Kutzneria buriramensis TaxID=1045776 RepID=A0A3E0HEY8_9PSEU|nr:GntR family transcriptional regulator [Kutzneria buriramensis]REH43777.1 DNA-binding transcriptional regulator YhcF (GntR family) [Kutzneria buriramensis]